MPGAPVHDLSVEQITVVKSLVPVLKKHGKTITKRMYTILFDADPNLRAYFSRDFPIHEGSQEGCPFTTSSAERSKLQSEDCTELKISEDKCCGRDQEASQKEGGWVMEGQDAGEVSFQAARLAETLIAYCAYVDELPKLEKAVARICKIHTMRQVTPEHYGPVGSAVIQAVGDVLGDAVTPEIQDALVAAYGVLVSLFTEKEAALKEAGKDQLGGWEGMREFLVVEKVTDSSENCVLVIESLDGACVAQVEEGPTTFVSAFWNDEKRGPLVKSLPLVKVPSGHDSQTCYALELSPSVSKSRKSSTDILIEKSHIGMGIRLSVPVVL
mmetsp:Transcript_15572/g.31509  ORF Transcript_15572/g.31509 Transcript_15572/m.31509 type:complete len:327 (-) Transcript_15572:67-1047(-)|eukprot:CAMPEP_0184686804 /NCGR_PEP_ID=MMETSP0312-20130426/24124_1 /TAXON_ID=31354 /ORGANISM="Compsopogon coeruleus, Strain SAG 36.94" /LENGTH=326 /DNA_ID=CAMNT_0027142299 /DNA_START=56 /DNA_END=1036 /DNA_ORIENTATION=+